jgi:hypothetical protein
VHRCSTRPPFLHFAGPCPVTEIQDHGWPEVQPHHCHRLTIQLPSTHQSPPSSSSSSSSQFPAPNSELPAPPPSPPPPWQCSDENFDARNRRRTSLRRPSPLPTARWSMEAVEAVEATQFCGGANRALRVVVPWPRLVCVLACSG